MTLLVSEVYINASKGWSIGEQDPYKPYTEDLRQLFLGMQREYGRCVSSIYVDPPGGGKPQRIGWVFSKRMRYEDARGNDPERDFYTREVWVTLHDAPDTKTITHHYRSLKGRGR